MVLGRTVSISMIQEYDFMKVGFLTFANKDTNNHTQTE